MSSCKHEWAYIGSKRQSLWRCVYCELLRSDDPHAKRPCIVFPTALRKMWSGSEVQAWLDEHVNKETT